MTPYELVAYADARGVPLGSGLGAQLLATRGPHAAAVLVARAAELIRLADALGVRRLDRSEAFRLLDASGGDFDAVAAGLVRRPARPLRAVPDRRRRPARAAA